MKAIFNREFKSYFTSMIGPVFVAALVLVTGAMAILTLPTH